MSYLFCKTLSVCTWYKVTHSVNLPKQNTMKHHTFRRLSENLSSHGWEIQVKKENSFAEWIFNFNVTLLFQNIYIFTITNMAHLWRDDTFNTHISKLLVFTVQICGGSIGGNSLSQNVRSSHPEVFCRKVFLKIHKKTPMPESLFNKFAC